MQINLIGKGYKYNKGSFNSSKTAPITPLYNNQLTQDTVSFGLSEEKVVQSLEQKLGKRLVPLLTRARIQKRIKGLARQIDKDYKGEDLYIICVMNGAKPFAEDLAKALKRPVRGTVKLASYEGTHSTGTVQVKRQSLPGIKKAKNILVIEDIVDTGNSMNFFVKHLREQFPKAKTKLCTLLDKKSARRPENEDLEVDYAGFEVGNKFVIGYGLDYNNEGRGLKHIYQAI